MHFVWFFSVLAQAAGPTPSTPPPASYHVCPNVKGVDAIEKFDKDYSAYREMKKAKTIETAQAEFNIKCAAWKLHEQDDSSISQLTSARNSLADKEHMAQGHLLYAEAQIPKAEEILKARHDRSGCLGNLSWMRKRLAKEQEDLKKMISFACK
jgi:hypothetical protein